MQDLISRWQFEDKKYLQVNSLPPIADNLCKQFGTRMSGLIWIQTIWHCLLLARASGCIEKKKDMLMVLLKNFFEKVGFEKSRGLKSVRNYRGGKEFRDSELKTFKWLTIISSCAVSMEFKTDTCKREKKKVKT